MAEPAHDRVPASLADRYSVGRRLGRGGMSTVYQATDRLLQREVAIKVFTARAESAADVERQEGEARLLASLNHYALTTLFDAGVDATEPDRPQIYLVMEYVPGDDLHEQLRRGPLAALQVCWLGVDLCEGLAFVHANGVLHRDIKPANVLLATREAETRLRGKLTDFGIASLLGSRDLEEWVTGTAAYLSPEQAEGGTPTAASDVYALGLVLLEALTGQVAFPGGIEESAFARLDRDPSISTEIPPAVATVLRGMTARRPEDRISLELAAAAFQDVLIDDVVRQRGLGAPRSGEKEAARLDALRRYDILDSPPEEAYDRVTRLAARVLNVPIAVVTIVDVDRVWNKSRTGVEVVQVDRNTSFCTTTDPAHGRPWSVPDALEDDRTSRNPLVVGEPHLRSYAAAPLVTHDGHTLGSLCVFDHEPRAFSDTDLETLQDLADVVMNEMELRLASRRALFER
jgi:hypothetical protein